MESDFKDYFMALTVQERDEFAKRCDSSRHHLTNIAYGKKPGEDLCINVERESGGKVRCETMRDDVDWAFIRSTGCDCNKTALPLAGRSSAVSSTA